MKNKFKNKYRITSTRLQHWDYRWNVAYFVTICTKDREHYFGNKSDGKMQLSAIGTIADEMWHEIKNHSKHVTLDAFVVMPDHVHGIIVIDRDSMHDCGDPIDDGEMGDGGDGPPKTIGQQRFQNQGKNSLSSLIGSY